MRSTYYPHYGYETKFEHTFPSGQVVEVKVSAKDIKGYEAEDMTLEFYDLTGNKLDVVYNQDAFIEIEIEALDQLIEIKETTETTFTKGHYYNGWGHYD